MKISKIILNNFRIYHGINEIEFSLSKTKNISIISGHNGFGKTSFLTSLVWCLYGKLMIEVDPKYKAEVLETGGYPSFCQNIYNHQARKLSEAEARESSNSHFSVQINFKDVLLPAFSCKNLSVKRTFNIANNSEETEVLIDNQINELSKQVGEEIFINDFILPREIAKFFFFDAEKIVDLAETKSLDEKRKLSKAYSEVLGIKKYEDLRNNLQNLQTRLRQKNLKGQSKKALEKFTSDINKLKREIAHEEEKIERLEEKLNLDKAQQDNLQEKLIREGSSITVDELKELRKNKKDVEGRKKGLRKEVQGLLELAPFAIAIDLMDEAKKQIDEERNLQNSIKSEFLDRNIVLKLKKEITKYGKREKVNKSVIKGINEIVEEKLEGSSSEDNSQILLSLTEEEELKFNNLYSNLKGSYSENLKYINKAYKSAQSEYNRIDQKIRKAESKKKDAIIKDILAEKTQIDEEIKLLELDLIDKRVNHKTLTNKLNSSLKQLSELTKKADARKKDKEKDRITKRLIAELEEFSSELKIKKKASLEERLKLEMNGLMHKRGFIDKVEVVIDGDLIEIELYDSSGSVIRKESLSKGEQQLFASALLKSLVMESSIKFPVFIDSPLQKLDKLHAKNIIKKIYPSVSDQVILLPLLEKELTENEYNWLLPKTGNVYLIENKHGESSTFSKYETTKLFIDYV